MPAKRRHAPTTILGEIGSFNNRKDNNRVMRILADYSGTSDLVIPLMV
jgi:hypothetical protein